MWFMLDAEGFWFGVFLLSLFYFSWAVERAEFFKIFISNLDFYITVKNPKWLSSIRSWAKRQRDHIKCWKPQKDLFLLRAGLSVHARVLDKHSHFLCVHIRKRVRKPVISSVSSEVICAFKWYTSVTWLDSVLFPSLAVPTLLLQIIYSFSHKHCCVFYMWGVQGLEHPLRSSKILGNVWICLEAP